jgi:hypothetical protein
LRAVGFDLEDTELRFFGEIDAMEEDGAAVEAPRWLAVDLAVVDAAKARATRRRMKTLGSPGFSGKRPASK